MNLPILRKLIEGEKFDFATLADNIGQLDEYWEWWWENQWKEGKILRPEVIENSDPILVETESKNVVDTICYRNFLDDPLFGLLNENLLPSAPHLDREFYRALCMKAVSVGTVSIPQPQLIFAGGGYGSGKSTALGLLASGDVKSKTVLASRGVVGVDMFKQLIPEFHLIKAVADGRASAKVQKECLMLLNRLFPLLIEHKRSFALDSSMSDETETLARIELAKKAGYELTLVAVLTTLDVSIRLAMSRAKISRRFPNPDALPGSHVLFKQHLMKYIPLFDNAVIFVNSGIDGKMLNVAEKKMGNELAVRNRKLFDDAMFIPKKA